MGNQSAKTSESKNRLLTESKTQLKTNSDSNQVSRNPINPSTSRRKSSIDSDIIPDYISSTSIKPIGNQSSGQSTSSQTWRQLKDSSRSSSKTITIPAEIVVVSDGSKSQESDQIVTFPPTFKPIIPIGHESLALNYPQIDPKYVIDLGLIVEEVLRTKSEFVAKEQNKIIDRIKDIDLITNHICGQFITERQKRLNKVSESLSKIQEIDCLIEKCEQDINRCLINFEKLNNYLPKSLSLEKFELQTTG